jgi:hypothetical protein
MMKQIPTLALILLTFLSSIPTGAQIFHGPDSARRSQHAAKKQQKALKKAGKKQRKAMRKYQKAQRRAARRQQRRAHHA